MTAQNSINNTSSIFSVDNLTLNGNTLSSTDTNGHIILAPEGDGDVLVMAAPIVPSTDRADSLGSASNSWNNVYCDGVSFDDGDNVLSDFTDSVAWLPVLRFGGGLTGITYLVQTGTYTRVGSIVLARLTIELSNKGTSTGSMSISGIPTNPLNFTACTFRINRIQYSQNYLQAGLSSGGVFVIEQVIANGSTIHILNDANFLNNTQITISVTFPV
jgi:hypothetical protein